MTRLMALCLVSLTSMPLPAAAQEIVFSPEATELCLQSVSPTAQRNCVGHSADVCITETLGGESTVGLTACYSKELAYWDDRLNGAYQALRALHRARDAENAALEPPVPALADALQAMQRAWIPYRDATCDYARAQWGGGTGGGPATASCLMQVTGEQALLLEFHLQEAQR